VCYFIKTLLVKIKKQTTRAVTRTQMSALQQAQQPAEKHLRQLSNAGTPQSENTTSPFTWLFILTTDGLAITSHSNISNNKQISNKTSFIISV